MTALGPGCVKTISKLLLGPKLIKTCASHLNLTTFSSESTSHFT
jgi:hypothetical protein